MQAERVPGAEKGAEDGHAEGAAGLPGGVQDAARHAGVLATRRADHRRGHGRHGQRDQAEQERAGQDQRERAGGSRRGEQGGARGRDREPGEHRRKRPEARGQPAADQRAEADRDAHRQQQEPGGQHRLMPFGLQVERQAEQGPVQDQVEDQADAGGAAEVLVPEQCQREDGVGWRRSAWMNASRPGGRGQEGAWKRGEPALLARGDEGGGEPGQHGRPEQQAGDVGPPVRVPRRLVREAPQQDDRQQADRHVDTEDRAPADRGDQGAAGHRAEGHPRRAHPAPHAERPGPRPRVGELVHDQRQRARRPGRAPRPWTARAAISTPGEGAAAQAAEPAANAVSPRVNTFLAPARSAAAPAVSMIEASARVYASMTHCSPASEPPELVLDEQAGPRSRW